jgi:diguanylate cyclase (GGDEF)-like protein
MPARDPITEFLTPRAFAELFDTQISDAVLAQSGVRVVAILVEHYGQVRASLGVDAANEMLHAVAHRLKHAVRADEILARVAEDRLLLVLEGVPEHAAGRVTERIRALFDGMMFTWEGREQPILVRVGLLELMPGEDLATMLQDAEHVLADASSRRQ